jgi:MarR family transcriptional regulator, lower aerobic nicotinate degradation pathway regulator
MDKIIVKANYLCKDLRMATSPTTHEAVIEFAGQLFFRLWRVSHTRTAEALESLGLTTALFALLNVLGTRDGAIQQELGLAMGVDPSTMVSLIDQLETAGLAKRRPRPTDRRAREVVITPKGRRVLEKARRLAMQVEDEVLRGLSGAERHQVLALLRRALDSAPTQAPWTAEEGD